jgi:hypothetical protein
VFHHNCCFKSRWRVNWNMQYVFTKSVDNDQNMKHDWEMQVSVGRRVPNTKLNIMHCNNHESIVTLQYQI